MSSLKIPKRDREKGMAIWCNKNSKRVTSKCCETGKSLHTCKFPESQIYISQKYDPVKKYMITIHRYPTSLRDFRSYKALHSKLVDEHSFIKFKPSISLPKRLLDCQTMYLDWEHDIDENGDQLHERKRKNKSKKTLHGIENYMRHFNTALRDSGIDPEYLLIDEVNEFHANIFYSYLSRKFSNSTYNHSIAQLRAFFNFLTSIHNYEIKNPFSADEFKKKEVSARKTTISLEDFTELCEFVVSSRSENYKFEDCKNPDGTYREKKKNMFRPWLIDAWKFALYTGLRPEEVAETKIKQIKEYYIEVFQPKIKNRVRWVPIIHDLKSLLDSMNIDGREGDSYIIAPDEINRNVVRNLPGNAFTHFIKQLFPEQEATRYSLRNTYATLMYMKYGESYAGITGLHSSVATTIKHYTNELEVLKTMTNDNLFG